MEMVGSLRIFPVVEDFVANDEILYRCVFCENPYGNKHYKLEDNRVLVSSQAFADRTLSPSIDRASLCGNNPRYTQKNPDDGVVSLICRDVRLIDSVRQNDSRGREEFTYKIDVLYRPLDDNKAHAQIEPTPAYRNRNVFRKLLERLAVLANQREWEILPLEFRQTHNNLE
jgi:hypothetical protein